MCVDGPHAAAGSGNNASAQTMQTTETVVADRIETVFIVTVLRWLHVDAVFRV